VEALALHDSAVPSGASLLSETNVALAALTGRRLFLERAEAYLGRMRDPALANPFGYGHLWCVADALVDGAPSITVVGSAPGRSSFLEVLDRTYAPTLGVAAFAPGQAPSVLAEVAEGKTAAGAAAAAYLCRRFVCEPPLTSADALRASLARPEPVGS
jgi:uncharacterized protein